MKYLSRIDSEEKIDKNKGDKKDKNNIDSEINKLKSDEALLEEFNRKVIL